MCIHRSNTPIFLLSACRKLFLNLKEAQVTNPGNPLPAASSSGSGSRKNCMQAAYLSVDGLRLDCVSQEKILWWRSLYKSYPEPSGSSAIRGARRKPEGRRHGSWIPKLRTLQHFPRPDNQWVSRIFTCAMV